MTSEKLQLIRDKVENDYELSSGSGEKLLAEIERLQKDQTALVTVVADLAMRAERAEHAAREAQKSWDESGDTKALVAALHVSNTDLGKAVARAEKAEQAHQKFVMEHSFDSFELLKKRLKHLERALEKIRDGDEEHDQLAARIALEDAPR